MLHSEHLLLSCNKFYYDIQRRSRRHRHFFIPLRLRVNPALYLSLRQQSLFHSAEIQHAEAVVPYDKPTPHHSHTHLQQLHKNTHFNGARYRYRSRALTFLADSLCSTPVRTTGYPCPPKPHNPHLHINLLFNIILCHSRPICHSASRLPPS